MSSAQLRYDECTAEASMLVFLFLIIFSVYFQIKTKDTK